MEEVHAFDALEIRDGIFCISIKVPNTVGIRCVGLYIYIYVSTVLIFVCKLMREKTFNYPVFYVHKNVSPVQLLYSVQYVPPQNFLNLSMD